MQYRISISRSPVCFLAAPLCDRGARWSSFDGFPKTDLGLEITQPPFLLGVINLYLTNNNWSAGVLAESVCSVYV